MSALVASFALGLQGALGVSLRRPSSSSVAPGFLPANWAPSASAGLWSDLDLNLERATLLHSNLGGLGPDGGDESMIIQNVAIVGAKPVDLRISVAANATYQGKPENNVLENGIIGININSHDSTSFDLQFLDRDGNPVRMSRFFLTILDIDCGTPVGDPDTPEGKNVELVGFRSYSTYYMLPQAQVLVTHKTEKDIWFGAKIKGTSADNPSSPLNLTRDQKLKAALVEFKDTAEIGMALEVTSKKGSSGRNLMISGISELGLPFAPCAEPQFLDIGGSEVVYNNLAGTVPGNGPTQTRYSRAGVINGVEIDLWVELLGGKYTPTDPTKNGVRGRLGQINMGPVNTAIFSFMFKVAGSQQPIELSGFFFSFYDIDQSDGGYEALTVSSGSGTFLLSNTTTLETIENGDGTVTFNSTSKGSEANNPRVPGAGGDNAVTLYFDKPLQSFEVTYETVASAGGRNFQFGSMAAAVCA